MLISPLYLQGVCCVTLCHEKMASFSLTAILHPKQTLTTPIWQSLHHVARIPSPHINADAQCGYPRVIFRALLRHRFSPQPNPRSSLTSPAVILIPSFGKWDSVWTTKI
ncbi:Uncharacterized protein HZ326_13790 [Fusarium oxysporum f. sp. albedinis]|nr:Uncharacterized protein HZ326_13790 [Fusarium oxysporum f. sp. albedinis]